MSSFVGGGGGGAGNSNRTELTQNTTYYVATTGSDITGNGSIGNPWATPQKAMEFIAEFIDTGNFDITVQMEDGTYSFGANPALLIKQRVGGGTLTFQGNIADKTKVVLSTTAPLGGIILTLHDLVSFNSTSNIGNVTVQFLQLVQNENSPFHSVLNLANSGKLRLNSIDYAGGLGLLQGTQSSYTEVDGDIGILTPGIQAASGSHIAAQFNSFIDYRVDSVTAAVPVSFGFGFVNAQQDAAIEFSLTSIIGSITGLPYYCDDHGVVVVEGSLTTIPGDVPGFIGEAESAVVFAEATGTFFNQIEGAFTDNGTTVTFDVRTSEEKTYTLPGDRTFAFINWPPATAPNKFRGTIELTLINGGAFNVTWPANINWVTGDGDTSTNFSDLGVHLHIAGANFIELWSDDGGTTIYGILKGSATFNFSLGTVPAAPSFPGIPHQIAWDVGGNMYICYQANTWAKYANIFTPPAPSTDAQPLGMP